MEGAMGYRNPPTNLFDPNTIEALGQAFNATWLEVQARDLTDPIELREWALEGYVRR
jgi:hypothetical protein